MAGYNDDFPIAFQTFASTLIGTDDEVWTRLLHQSHGHRKLSEKGWREVLAECQGTPASPQIVAEPAADIEVSGRGRGSRTAQG